MLQALTGELPLCVPLVLPSAESDSSQQGLPVLWLAACPERWAVKMIDKPWGRGAEVGPRDKHRIVRTDTGMRPGWVGVGGELSVWAH